LGVALGREDAPTFNESVVAAADAGSPWRFRGCKLPGLIAAPQHKHTKKTNNNPIG
jgi:hypothetical protein